MRKKLPAKRKAIADEIIKDPTITAKEAAKRVDPTLTDFSAGVVGSRALNDERIVEYMEKHAVKAQKKVVKLMDSEKEEIALRASQDVLDRVYGKAIQRNENTNANINVILHNYNVPINNEEKAKR